MNDVAIALGNKPWGRAISSLDANATLANYEDALDKHYYKESISALKGQDAANSLLRRYLHMEIDHNNNIFLFELTNKRQIDRKLLNLLKNKDIISKIN